MEGQAGARDVRAGSALPREPRPSIHCRARPDPGGGGWDARWDARPNPSEGHPVRGGPANKRSCQDGNPAVEQHNPGEAQGSARALLTCVSACQSRSPFSQTPSSSRRACWLHGPAAGRSRQAGAGRSGRRRGLGRCSETPAARIDSGTVALAPSRPPHARAAR